ncbi:TRAP transporter substrate-binding protein DctP [Oceanobacillus jeddahense]|uniref:TRAP transporter substrate-binding protein DctP n=1 Tax=Oceanobacillus jeddahense TaxID=1462527 RepID=A0ABY5JQX1_9BACI|nr:TRAP transporter substrate-binding protein DctP [Oceanobacillus jeddahense]UUI01872.1 TRAP transporter substrate-binding protein DctP [Oceanobacillus jeddahense]
MFRKKRFYLFVFTVVISVVLASCSNDRIRSEASTDGEEITLKFAHEEGQGDVQDLYANKFKEVIEEKTNGRIKVDVYTGGTLGTSIDILHSLQTGAIELAITSPGFSGDVIPESQIMSIPFLFSDNLEVNKKVLQESEALNGLLADKYEEIGIIPFHFWLEGFMYWTANQEITAPEDMNGTKMRTMPTNLIIRSYEHLGATPTTTDSGEIYTMLQTNGIDGQENPLFYIVNGNFLEVQDYLMDTKHHIYTTVTVTNQEFFEGLAKEDQQIIEEAIDEVNDWSFDMQEEEAEKALEKAKEDDIEIIELTSEQREAFEELSLPIREVYGEESNDAKAIIEMLEKEIKEAEADLAE